LEPVKAGAKGKPMKIKRVLAIGAVIGALFVLGLAQTSLQTTNEQLGGKTLPPQSAPDSIKLSA
jgi:hypothetical protein